jgi:hypothetical protein
VLLWLPLRTVLLGAAPPLRTVGMTPLDDWYGAAPPLLDCCYGSPLRTVVLGAAPPLRTVVLGAAPL